MRHTTGNVRGLGCRQRALLRQLLDEPRPTKLCTHGSHARSTSISRALRSLADRGLIVLTRESPRVSTAFVADKDALIASVWKHAKPPEETPVR